MTAEKAFTGKVATANPLTLSGKLVRCEEWIPVTKAHVHVMKTSECMPVEKE